MNKKQNFQKIFLYDNYRNFMCDYFAEQKKLRQTFSHRFFAQRAGFASSSFCMHVMEGKKNLSLESIGKVISGIGLSGKAAQYFETLVQFNQASSPGEKERLFSILNRLRKSARFYKVNKMQYRFYDEWYYSIIRELAVYSDWKGDYAYLGKLVSPPVSAEKAKQAINLLCEMGLLSKGADNKYYQTDAALSAEQIPSIIVNRLKKDFLFRGLEAEERLKKPARYSSSVTLAMSDAVFEKAKSMIDDVRRAILVMAMDDQNVEKIFQANFQIFPVSEHISDRQGES